MITQQELEVILGYVQRNEPLPLVEVKKLTSEILRLYELLEQIRASADRVGEKIDNLSETNRKLSEALLR